MKRFCSFIILISFSLSLIFPLPVNANSFGPLNNLKKALDATDPVTGTVPVADSKLRAKEVEMKVFGKTMPFSLDGLLWNIGKTIIDLMSDSVVRWVNSGYKGGPSFVTDPRVFFTDIADSIGGTIINDVGAGAVCSPFKLQIQGSIRNTITGLKTKPGDTLKNRCTFSAALGNIQNFIQGDFSQGGWNSWFTLTQNRQNNPYGAYVETDTELNVRIGNSQDLAKLEMNWSDGFLSPRDFPADCQKIDPNNNNRCIEWKPIKTPGKVIEKSLEGALGTELKQLEIADEVDEIIGAVLGRLIKDIAQKSLFKISPSYATGPGGGGSSNPLSGSCLPDRTDSVIGDTITWSAVGSGTNLSYQWSGTDGLTGTNQSASITYNLSGRKDASVIITDTIIDPATNVATKNTSTIQCQPSVNVAKFPPITGTCQAFNSSGQTFTTISAWTPMEWRITSISGGSGVFQAFIWDGTNPIVKTGIGSPYGTPGPSLPGNGFKFFQSRILGTSGMKFSRWYDQNGNQNATIQVIDADSTMKPGLITCPDITVF